MSEQRNSLRTIFADALAIADPQQRAAFLSQACATDGALRREVEELMQAHTAAHQFLRDDPTFAEVRAALVDSADALRLRNAVSDARMSETPGDRIGHYKLLEQIGEGGCGVVYMAEQEKPVRRRVALKVIKLGMDTKQVVARFEAERQALALMDHPSIAKVFDAGVTEAGRPYFVMELVRGTKITEYCDDNELSARERLELFIQVCLAVQHSHQKGVIHRDLKPSNILVTILDSKPLPKIIDFGIAKATEGRLTERTLFTAFHQVVGTPAYMSPEQTVLTNQDIDTRSDIYSLGVLLYELLTGKTPFDTRELLAAGVEEMRRTIREREPLRPSTRLKNMGQKELSTTAKRRQLDARKLVQLARGDLDSIVGRCLEKERARRYETANGLAADVQRHLNHEPIVARPASLVYRLSKAARRNRWAFTSGAAVAVTLLVGVIASTWQGLRAEHERQRFQQNVVHQYVGRGTRSIDDGDLFGALLWYTKALELDAGDPLREKPHRIRIASMLRQCPRLTAFSHGTTLHHGEFSKKGDQLLTASDDGTARSWDLANGRQLLVLRHGGEVYDARFSPDGSLIVTASQDKTARIWDSRTGACLREIKQRDGVRCACFSFDGRLVATACDDGTAQLWETATGRPVGSPLQHENHIVALTFSPDGRFLATTAEHDTASIWEVATGQSRWRGAHTGNRTEVAFSPDSQRFLTCDGSDLRIWDLGTFKEVPFSPLHHFSIIDLCFSPDGRAILTASRDFTAQAWDATTGAPLFSPSVRHAGPVTSARFSPDGRRFVTGGNDAVARVWSTATGQPIGPPLKTILMSRHVACNADGHRLLVRGCEGVARVWDLATADLPGPSRPIFENEHRIISPSRRHFLRLGQNNTVWIAETQTGNKLAALPHTNALSYASFNRDGSTVLTICQDDTGRNDIFLWEAPTGRRLNTVSMAARYRVLYAAFSPGNSSLLTCSLDFVANLWDARTGQSRGALPHGGRVTWGAFSPDGRSVVTACWDKTVRVWDAATGTPQTPPLQHKRIVVGAVWSADGKRLSTVTEDDYLQVWDLASAEPLTPPRKIHLLDEATTSIRSRDKAPSSEDLPCDNRSVAELVQLSQMLAESRIDAGGNVVPLTMEELDRASPLLRGRFPAQSVPNLSEVVAWYRLEAQESAAEGNLSAALFHLDRALELAPDDSLLAQKRTTLAALLEPGTNSGSYQLSRWSIPPRDANAGENQIDLSRHYNLSLQDSLDQRSNRDSFSELQAGLQMLGGASFDVRGLLHLNGQGVERDGQAYPEIVTGVRVGRKCQRLHFLQATSGRASRGERVGSYVLHYADGQRQELPVLFGRDTGEWYFWGIPYGTTEPGAAVVAWTGRNSWAARHEASICLYKSVRENPRPAVELVSIDFVSSMSEAAPFLAALTVE
jgi:WD40 repeat protein/serine/threonine protein kinase